MTTVTNKVNIKILFVNHIMSLNLPAVKAPEKGEHRATNRHNTLDVLDSGTYEVDLPYPTMGKGHLKSDFFLEKTNSRKNSIVKIFPVSLKGIIFTNHFVTDDKNQPSFRPPWI